METNLTFHLHYTYKKITLQQFISGYLIRKEIDQNVLKVVNQDSDKIEYLISKKIPCYIKLFLNISNIEYLESVHMLENKAEVNVWQTLGNISSQANMTITENNSSNETTILVVFKVNNISSLFKSKIKSYIIDEFNKEMLEISKHFKI